MDKASVIPESHSSKREWVRDPERDLYGSLTLLAQGVQDDSGWAFLASCVYADLAPHHPPHRDRRPGRRLDAAPEAI